MEESKKMVEENTKVSQVVAARQMNATPSPEMKKYSNGNMIAPIDTSNLSMIEQPPSASPQSFSFNSISTVSSIHF